MTWESEYLQKVKTADVAMRFVNSGMRVYIQPGCAEPETLVEALIRRAPEVRDVEIVHMMTMGVAPYVAPEMAGTSGITPCLSVPMFGMLSMTAAPTIHPST